MKALVAWWGKICEWLRVPGPPDGVGRSHFRLRDVVGAGLSEPGSRDELLFYKKSLFKKSDTLATGGGRLNQAVVEMRSYLQ